MALTLDAYNVASNSFNDSLRNLNSINETRLQDEERKRRFLLDRMKYDTTIGDPERQKLKKQLDDGFGISGTIKSLFTSADPSEVANTSDLQREKAKADAGLVLGDASTAWTDKVAGFSDHNMTKGEKKKVNALAKSADGLYMTDGKLYRNVKDGKAEGVEDFVTDELNNYEVIDGKRYKKSPYEKDKYDIEGFRQGSKWDEDSYDYKEVTDKEAELEGKRALKDIKGSKDYYFDKAKGRWYRKSTNDKYNDSYTPGEVGLGDIKYKEGVDTSKDVQKMKDDVYAEDRKANPEKYERQYKKGDMSHYRQYAEDQGIYTEKFTGSKAEQIGQNQRLYENLIAEALRRGDTDAAERFNREYKANLMNIDKYWGDDRGGKYEDLWVMPKQTGTGTKEVKRHPYQISIIDKNTGVVEPGVMLLSDDEFTNFNTNKNRIFKSMYGKELEDSRYIKLQGTGDTAKVGENEGEQKTNAVFAEAKRQIASGEKTDYKIVKDEETGVETLLYKNATIMTNDPRKKEEEKEK